MRLYFSYVELNTGLFCYSFTCGMFSVGEIRRAHEFMNDANEHIVCRISPFSFLSEFEPSNIIRQWN